MKIKITKKKDSPFTNSDGDTMDYFWYNAERLSDGVNFRFGSQNGQHKVDEEVDLEIEKYERENGKIAYKELRED